MNNNRCCICNKPFTIHETKIHRKGDMFFACLDCDRKRDGELLAKGGEEK